MSNTENKKRKRRKTSVFRGVLLDKKTGGWICRIRAAGFHRRCKSEVEAAAYYNIVAMYTWKGLSEKQLNNMWKVYPNTGFVQVGQETVRVLDIDRTHYALIDEEFYSLKDCDWFLEPKTGMAIMITDCSKENGEWRFTYVKMHEWIFGGPCVHLNRNPRDNRKKNLAESGIALEKRPVKPLSEHIDARDIKSQELLEFEGQLTERLDWEKQMRESRFAYGVEPSDPRESREDWKEWVRKNGGQVLRSWVKDGEEHDEGGA